MDAGIILKNPSHPSVRGFKKKYAKLTLRGFSTEMEQEKTIKYLDIVYNLRSNISTRRAEILKAMDISEDKAWGKGLLIFCEKLNANIQTGSHTRFLPLAISVPIKPNTITSRNSKKVTRENVQKETLSSINKWLDKSKETMDKHDRILVEFLGILPPGCVYTGKHKFIDQVISTAMEENKEFKPEKKKLTDSFNKALVNTCGLIIEFRMDDRARGYKRNDDKFS